MKRVKVRGSARMKAEGNKLVSVWLDPHEAALIETAAAVAGLKLSTWVRRAAFEMAAVQMDSRPLLARTTLEGGLPKLR